MKAHDPGPPIARVYRAGGRGRISERGPGKLARVVRGGDV